MRPSSSGHKAPRDIFVEIAGERLAVRVATEKNLGLLSERFGSFLTFPATGRRGTGSFNILKKEAVWRGDIYKFENVLRRIYSVLLVKKGGFLLHASGVIISSRPKKSIGKQAVIFSGKSTSGKSTIASAFPSEKILSDELVAIVKNKKKYAAYPTPFRGFKMKNNSRRKTTTEIYRLNKTIAREPLLIKYIFFLTKKSAPLKIISSGRADIYRNMLKNSFFLPPRGSNKKSAARKLINNISRFALWADKTRKSFFLESSLKDIAEIKKLVGKNLSALSL